MKSGILLVFCLVGCQSPPNISSETPGPNAPALVVLNPMPKTGKEGPVSKPNRNGISIQAVESDGRDFLTLRLINNGTKPVQAYMPSGSMAVDCEIISVPSGVWRQEQMMMIDPVHILPQQNSFISLPRHKSISIEVHSIPIREKIRRGTYIATVSYDDVLVNSYAERNHVKVKSEVGRTEKVKVLVETNGEGYCHATPIL